MFTFTITRDEYGNGGYTVAKLELEINTEKYNYLVIGKVDKNGPAFKVGLNNNYIGYAIVRVNGIEMVDADDFMASIDQTKNPNETFSITIQRLFEKDSEQEQLLIRTLEK